MRLGTLALVLCFALTGCGGGEEESASGESSGSSESAEPLEATEGSSGPDYEAYSDAELCAGPLQAWLEADAAASTELQKASGSGPLSPDEIETILLDSDATLAGLATADDEELASLAQELPELNREFAVAFAGQGGDSATQNEVISQVTDAKAAMIDRCLSLSTQ